VIRILGSSRNALAMKAREERSRAGPIKTLIVIEDTYLQVPGAPK
jgi:hypothetical protein